ncbi:ABC transporter substrate-binding protein [Pseudoruegeria sp. HB172150]|uniref:ABC transporter substrate-binding protein n=1 Tax=Pseudoruegeria sp. HB172150 TaxID=2721164 RepID=UPI001552CF24|nr:ABC transporter substrate-binding protein [Pseudoruegeria sp. HB172150]
MQKAKQSGRAGFMAAAVLALTAAAAAAQDPYRIGMSIDLTGPISFNGKIAAAGLETYVDKLNAEGGVNGRQVELTVADDASDLAKGKANTQRFADNGSLAAFGFILTSVSAAVAPQAAEDEIPIVGLGGLEELLNPPQPYYFSYELTAADLSLPILQFIEQHAAENGIETPRVAILVVDVPSNHQVAERAAAEIEKRGWTVAETQYFAISPTDITSQAAAIRASKPDYVLMSHNDAGALVGVKGLRRQGISVPVINQWAGSADATIEQLGEGYYAFRTFVGPAEEGNPAIEEMRAAAEEHGYSGDMTNSYFTQGYVGGMILEKALMECGADCASGAEFAAALEKVGEIDTGGMAGPLAINADTHEAVKSVRFYTWDDAEGGVVAVTDWIGKGTE